MRAAVLAGYDKNGRDLELRELPTPDPGPGEVLVQIGAFAERSGFPAWKRLAFGIVGRTYDKMAAKRGQQYRFVFVHEDGAQLERHQGVFRPQHRRYLLTTLMRWQM